MNNEDLQTVHRIRDSVVDCAILRYAEGGNIRQEFIEPISSFDRSRIHQAFFQKVEDAFGCFGLHAKYNDTLKGFKIFINLNDCPFNTREAKFFSNAREKRINDGTHDM